MSRSTAARRVPAEVASEKKIPLRNGLPAFPGHDIAFSLRALRELRNEKGETIGCGTITDVVRAMGLADRAGTGGGPSTAYLRVRAALHQAKDQGLVECVARVWAVVAS